MFLSHCILEIKSSGFHSTSILDDTGMKFRSELGQLVVVLFLFYSGYGVMESIIQKGETYIDRFPRHRLLQTLLNFDVAVVCFFFLNLALGIPMSFKQVGFSMIGWESIGNSNWYVFVILYCYLVTWIASKAFLNDRFRIALGTTILVFVGEIALSYLKHGQTRWYNTILCYPLGVYYSIFKDSIISISKKYYILILVVLSSIFVSLHFQRFVPALHGLSYNAKAIVFTLLIVHLSMKFRLNNSFFHWAGVNLFPIYIYQRIPMIAIANLTGLNWIISKPWLFIIICATTTGCIALFYKYWRIRLV